LQALVPYLPEQSAVVERAAELSLPPLMQGFTSSDFPAQIQSAAALPPSPRWLVIDEIRFDEADALWHIFQNVPQSRLLWVIHAATRPDRLFAAFGMLLRRAAPKIDSAEIVRLLVERLPVVILCGRRTPEQVGVIGIGEWHANPDDPAQAVLKLSV
jgi:hypothetical protein